MKIVVIGGHLSPALSVLSELKNHEVLYLGRKHVFEEDKTESLEYHSINSLNIQFKNIITGRLQRNFTIQTVFSLLKLPIGIVQSFFILKKFKPDIILGFGSYVELPVILSAFVLKIPIIIHEQSLGAGLSNRISSFFAKKILISWESSMKFFPKGKTVLTGNPLHPEILASSENLEKENSDIKTIYITGGGSGSHAINLLVERACSGILNNSKIIHQTGDAKEYGDFERLTELRNRLPESLQKRYLLKKFLTPKEVKEVLKNCHLVVSRAGMNTICELIFFEKPSLLIPLPIGREQRQNALFLKTLGLAEVLDQKNLTTFQFQNAVESMLKHLESYRKNSGEIKKIIKTDASKKIAEEVLDAAKKI